MIEELELVEKRYREYTEELAEARRNNVPENLTKPLEEDIRLMEGMIATFSLKFLGRFPKI